MPFGTRNNKKANKLKRLARKDKPLKWGLEVLEKSVNFRPYYLYRDHCSECSQCHDCHGDSGPLGLDLPPPTPPAPTGGCSSGRCGLAPPPPPPAPTSGCSSGRCGLAPPPPPPAAPTGGCSSGRCGLAPPAPPAAPTSGCSSGRCGLAPAPAPAPTPTKYPGCCRGPGSTPGKCGYYYPENDNYGSGCGYDINNPYNPYNINMTDRVNNQHNIHGYLDKYF